MVGLTLSQWSCLGLGGLHIIIILYNGTLDLWNQKLNSFVIERRKQRFTEGKVCLRQHTQVFIGPGAFLRLGASEADPETKIILQVIYKERLSGESEGSEGSGTRKAEKSPSM